MSGTGKYETVQSLGNRAVYVCSVLAVALQASNAAAASPAELRLACRHAIRPPAYTAEVRTQAPQPLGRALAV